MAGPHFSGFRDTEHKTRTLKLHHSRLYLNPVISLLLLLLLHVAAGKALLK